jgi:hypothetical protein
MLPNHHHRSCVECAVLPEELLPLGSEFQAVIPGKNQMRRSKISTESAKSPMATVGTTVITRGSSRRRPKGETTDGHRWTRMGDGDHAIADCTIDRQPNCRNTATTIGGPRPVLSHSACVGLPCRVVAPVFLRDSAVTGAAMVLPRSSQRAARQFSVCLRRRTNRSPSKHQLGN